MHWLDWSVLGITLISIVVYGIWKTRTHTGYEDYMTGSRSTPWWAVGLSIMATQASAITFISTPGLGFERGLSFVQFYYGLPIAMFIVAMWFAPRFFHLKVLTAYEFLEKRFSLETRLFTAGLFLIQRGLAAGVTIFAPSIILSKVLGWDLLPNILIIGTLVIIYTISGGTKAVTQTHKQQMAVIFIGLFIAFWFLVDYISDKSSVSSVLTLAKKQQMLQAFDLHFNLEDRYNVWSGIFGGTFLMLSYFGTDQSQVQRYLGGKNLSEIRIGLAFNAILKIPMQFFILFIGILVMGFYTLHERPVSFNKEKSDWLKTEQTAHYKNFEARQNFINSKKEEKGIDLNDMESIAFHQKVLDSKIADLTAEKNYKTKVKDSDYVFISWILDWLPVGLIGLLLAVIFSAAMSSTAAELNALATTSMVDFYDRLSGVKHRDKQAIRITRIFTLIWGLIAMGFAALANLIDNLVEFVNILGSLFYGTVLGVFLVALYIKFVRSKAVLTGAIIAQIFILFIHFYEDRVVDLIGTRVAFLWYNLIACALVIMIAMLTELFIYKDFKRQAAEL